MEPNCNIFRNDKCKYLLHNSNMFFIFHKEADFASLTNKENMFKKWYQVKKRLNRNIRSNVNIFSIGNMQRRP